MKYKRKCDLLAFNPARLSVLIDECHPERHVRDHVRVALWYHWRGDPVHLPIIRQEINPYDYLASHATESEMFEALTKIGIDKRSISGICGAIRSANMVKTREPYNNEYMSRAWNRKSKTVKGYFKDKRTQVDDREYAVLMPHAPKF